MAKALVLGGDSGLLGQALAGELGRRGWEVEKLGRKDGNLLDFAWLEERINNGSPDALFNTIAWTQVDDAEEHPKEALLWNRTFPDALARIISARPETRLVHYSTDFVFSGPAHGPWKEDDTPCPASVYGTTKLEGERAVLEVLPNRALVLRTAWLFGPGRRNFVQAILDVCAERQAASVVLDQTGSPTFTPDLAAWSAALVEGGQSGLWHAVNSGQASWCDLAMEAVALSGCKCRVEPITSEKWPQKAPRPAYSVLDNSKLAGFLGKKPRPWAKALRDYIFSAYEVEGEA